MLAGYFSALDFYCFWQLASPSQQTLGRQRGKLGEMGVVWTQRSLKYQRVNTFKVYTVLVARVSIGKGIAAAICLKRKVTEWWGNPCGGANSTAKRD